MQSYSLINRVRNRFINQNLCMNRVLYCIILFTSLMSVGHFYVQRIMCVHVFLWCCYTLTAVWTCGTSNILFIMHATRGGPLSPSCAVGGALYSNDFSLGSSLVAPDTERSCICAAIMLCTMVFVSVSHCASCILCYWYKCSFYVLKLSHIQCDAEEVLNYVMSGLLAIWTNSFMGLLVFYDIFSTFHVYLFLTGLASFTNTLSRCSVQMYILICAMFWLTVRWFLISEYGICKCGSGSFTNGKHILCCLTSLHSVAYPVAKQLTLSVHVTMHNNGAPIPYLIKADQQAISVRYYLSTRYMSYPYKSNAKYTYTDNNPYMSWYE